MLYHIIMYIMSYYVMSSCVVQPADPEHTQAQPCAACPCSCESQALNAKVGQGHRRSASNVDAATFQLSRIAVVWYLQPSLSGGKMQR